METRYGYPLFRMNTEYANIRYGTGRLRYVPQGGTFEVSGNTPSATYNGISKQSTDNKTWNNDFENIAKGGSNIKYLYDVERRERSYGPWTWYEYETFWANCSDCKDLNGNTKPLVRAEVETTWRTKKDHHWIEVSKRTVAFDRTDGRRGCMKERRMVLRPVYPWALISSKMTLAFRQPSSMRRRMESLKGSSLLVRLT